MTAYSDGIAMKNQNDPARKDDKREWSAPKVERRSMIDRTQGGILLYTRESSLYRPS
jgi:hypothetical protein